MQTIEIQAGSAKWPLLFDAQRLLTPLQKPATNTTPPREQVAYALERPLRFEALRRALTPDDHICVVLDERLPHLAELIAGVMDHLATAGIDPDAVTLLSPNPESKQAWLEELPDELSDVKTAIHTPNEPKKLAYLATTKSDHRVYLSRVAVEAEFVIVLTAHRFDGRTGERLLCPGIADAETQAATLTDTDVSEVCWLLGTPFFVRVIEGRGDSVETVIGGFAETLKDADAARDALWATAVNTLADLVIATVPEAGASFEDLAVAVTAAANAVKPGGKIVLSTAANPPRPEAFSVLNESRDADSMRKKLRKHKVAGWESALAWLDATTQAPLFVSAEWPAEQVETLLATPLVSASELQRLMDGEGTLIVIEDAHRAKVLVKNATS
ncbi:hypothetical protein BH11PLA2_BH11PLA2_38730 [soil metagenome]